MRDFILHVDLKESKKRQKTMGKVFLCQNIADPNLRFIMNDLRHKYPNTCILALFLEPWGRLKDRHDVSRISLPNRCYALDSYLQPSVSHTERGLQLRLSRERPLSCILDDIVKDRYKREKKKK